MTQQNESKDIPLDPAEKFSVFHYSSLDESQVREHYLVPIEQALHSAEHLMTSVAARMGWTKRVIITDALDRLCFEWKYGEGITFPPKPEKHNG